MTFREYLKENNVNDIFNVQIPVDKKTLNVLYKEINKKYFNNILPIVDVKFAPLAKNYYGKAHCTFTPENKIEKMLITISSKIVNDANRIINTLAHEMIHIWQFTMNEKTKSKTYTSATWAEIMSSNDKHTWGHNKYFMDEMSRLNKLGFNIDVVGDSPNGIELSEKVYCLLINENIFLWTPKDPSKNLESIFESVSDRTGEDVYTYTLFSTLESNVTLTTRITKDWKLPANVLNIKYKREWILSILKDASVIIIKTENIEKEISSDSKGVQDEIKKLLPQIAKWKGEDFQSYFKNCWINAFPELRTVIGRELYSEGRKFRGISVPNKLSDDDVDYIYKDWLNIKDTEIKKSKVFSYFFTDLKYMVMKKKTDLNAINKVINEFENTFKDRISFEKYKSILKEVIINEIKKDFKKSGKTYDENYLLVLNHFLKGTKLEDVLK